MNLNKIIEDNENEGIEYYTIKKNEEKIKIDSVEYSKTDF